VLGTGVEVFTAALDEYCLDDVVTRSSVLMKVRCEIYTVVAIPQMVVWIDDLTICIDRRLDGPR